MCENANIGCSSDKSNPIIIDLLGLPHGAGRDKRQTEKKETLHDCLSTFSCRTQADSENNELFDVLGINGNKGFYLGTSPLFSLV